ATGCVFRWWFSGCVGNEPLMHEAPGMARCALRGGDLTGEVIGPMWASEVTARSTDDAMQPERDLSFGSSAED
ncbi:hypothetical protein KDW41_30490, partial [Burkholderia vietnamiensis]|nr:hypothetical protein [Burkholderia vietnamiensis]